MRKNWPFKPWSGARFRKIKREVSQHSTKKKQKSRIPKGDYEIVSGEGLLTLGQNKEPEVKMLDIWRRMR